MTATDLTTYGYDETVLESLDELGCAGDGCGCLVKFRLRWSDAGRIEQAHFWSREIGGNGPAYDFANTLAAAAVGLNLVEASALGKLNLVHDEAAEQVMVAEDAFHHALGVRCMQVMAAGTSSFEAENPTGILVAMSGGVDSAVCLHRSARMVEGNVVGCTLRLWIDPAGPDPDRACCAPDSVRRARHTCHREGYGHLSLDMRHKFKQVIVDDFIKGYKAGETPNPCVRCNGHFRLEELVSAADAVGMSHVSTGHYVRTEVRGGVTLAVRGVDPRKDQSYMLSSVDPSILARYIFPLGNNVKTEVRAEAASLGLEQAKIKGSQDVCFLGGGNYRDFLNRAKADGQAGDVVLSDGRVIGSHDGLAGFTPGQRKGIPVEGRLVPKPLAGIPLYVKQTDPKSGNVVVGTRDEVLTNRVPLRALKMYTDQHGDLTIQVRYRSGSGQLTGRIAEDGKVFLSDTEIFGAAAGQVAVLYDGDTVVGRAFVSRER